MAINSISGSVSNLPVIRPEPQRKPQTVQSAQEPTARQATERTREEQRPEENIKDSEVDLQRANATRQARQQLTESSRAQSFELESDSALRSNNSAENNGLATRSASDRNETTTNLRVDRNDQARDALKARFEENSRPKPEPAFEVRA